MLEHDGDLDKVFAALADPTRRAMVDRLVAGPVSVTELARPFPMTLAAVMQHLKVLRDSGLVSTEKHGRVRTCRVEPSRLRAAERWLAERRTPWELRLDRLSDLIDGPDPAHSPDGQPPTHPNERTLS